MTPTDADTEVLGREELPDLLRETASDLKRTAPGSGADREMLREAAARIEALEAEREKDRKLFRRVELALERLDEDALGRSGRFWYPYRDELLKNVRKRRRQLEES